MKVRKHSGVPRLLGAFLAAGALTFSATLAGNAAAHPGHDHGSDSGDSGSGSTDSSAKRGGAGTRGGAGAGAATGGGTGSKPICPDTGVPTTAACNSQSR